MLRWFATQCSGWKQDIAQPACNGGVARKEAAHLDDVGPGALNLSGHGMPDLCDGVQQSLDHANIDASEQVPGQTPAY